MRARLTRALIRVVSRWMFRGGPPPSSIPATPLPHVVQQARGILVVALAEAGDLILLSPFLRGLRRLAPSARITLVTPPGCVVLFAHCDDVDEVVPYPTEGRRLLRPIVLPRRARAFAAQRLQGPFNLAIVPRWDTDHHLATAVALFSGASRRVGYSERVSPRKETLNAGFDAAYTDLLDSSGVAHEVDRHAAMLRALGAASDVSDLELGLTPSDRRRAGEELSAVGSGHRLVAFGVGAAHPKRRWPIARFAEVGQRLQHDFGVHVLIVGGPHDQQAQDELLRVLGPAATGLAGRLTLRESAAVLERSQLFIGNDSAPLHLAAAARIPCIEISCHPEDGDPLHNNAPERFGPWRVPGAVLRPTRAVPPCVGSCSARLPHCILEVSPEIVIQAAITILNPPAVAVDVTHLWSPTGR